jgi:ribosomal protein S1
MCHPSEGIKPNEEVRRVKLSKEELQTLSDLTWAAIETIYEPNCETEEDVENFKMVAQKLDQVIKGME